MTPRKTVVYIGQLKPGLHIVVTIAEHASDLAPKEDFEAVNTLIANISCEICYCM